jgi:hypothetical protein
MLSPEEAPPRVEAAPKRSSPTPSGLLYSSSKLVRLLYTGILAAWFSQRLQGHRIEVGLELFKGQLKPGKGIRAGTKRV